MPDQPETEDEPAPRKKTKKKGLPLRIIGIVVALLGAAVYLGSFFFDVIIRGEDFSDMTFGMMQISGIILGVILIVIGCLMFYFSTKKE